MSSLLPRLFSFEQDRRELEPIAVVDIGSNSVRLVVYDGAVRAPTPLFNEKVLAGLGRTIATTGRLDEAGVDRTIRELERFRAIARILGVKNVRAIATAASRDASNGPDFIARAERALGVHIEIISGLVEAELAAAGVRMGFERPDGIIGDFGGGSLELIDIRDTMIDSSTSLKIGGLTLMDMVGGKLDKAVDLVDEALASIPWLDNGKGRTFYAVGGTWRSVAKMNMQARDYPLRVMQGYTLATADAVAFAETIRKARKFQSLAGAEAVAKARRDVLPFGALVLERLLLKFKPDRVVFSVYGIREGLVYRLLSPADRARDPLLSFARTYAELRSRSPVHGQELCAWTDQLFGTSGISETADERRLRHAACLLSDIGWRAHPDYRGEQTLSVVAHSGMAGIDHAGRVYLSLALYFRHVGVRMEEDSPFKLPFRLRQIVPDRLYERAQIVGAAIRAAHMLSIGRAGVIDEVRLQLDASTLTVVLPAVHAALDGERFRRRFETLAKVINRKPIVEVAR